jgi:hypothetical protein
MSTDPPAVVLAAQYGVPCALVLAIRGVEPGPWRWRLAANTVHLADRRSGAERI